MDALSIACVSAIPPASWSGVTPRGIRSMLKTAAGRHRVANIANVSAFSLGVLREMESSKVKVLLSEEQCASLSRAFATKTIMCRKLNPVTIPAEEIPVVHSHPVGKVSAKILATRRGERGGGPSEPTTAPINGILVVVAAGCIWTVWRALRRKSTPIG